MVTMDEMNKPGDEFYAQMVRKVVNAAINSFTVWTEEQRRSCAGSASAHLAQIKDYKVYARALLYIMQCPDLHKECERREWS